ncbi:hypothetical protein [Amycolatopsis echigonensis]|nr:hypothetical protein [Amycolatopsis niigatensis]
MFLAEAGHRIETARPVGESKQLHASGNGSRFDVGFVVFVRRRPST